MIVACCWLHNYYELKNEVKSYVANVAFCKDPLVGFGNARLLVYREGKQAKRDGED